MAEEVGDNRRRSKDGAEEECTGAPVINVYHTVAIVRF